MLTGVEVLHIGGLFDPELLVSSDHHPTHFKGAVVLIMSEILLCSDDFVITFPHCLVTTTDLFQLGVPPGSMLTRTARGPHLLAELFVGRLYNCLLSV